MSSNIYLMGKTRSSYLRSQFACKIARKLAKAPEMIEY